MSPEALADLLVSDGVVGGLGGLVDGLGEEFDELFESSGVAHSATVAVLFAGPARCPPLDTSDTKDTPSRSFPIESIPMERDSQGGVRSGLGVQATHV